MLHVIVLHTPLFVRARCCSINGKTLGHAANTPPSQKQTNVTNDRSTNNSSRGPTARRGLHQRAHREVKRRRVDCIKKAPPPKRSKGAPLRGSIPANWPPPTQTSAAPGGCRLQGPGMGRGCRLQYPGGSAYGGKRGGGAARRGPPTATKGVSVLEPQLLRASLRTSTAPSLNQNLNRSEPQSEPQLLRASLRTSMEGTSEQGTSEPHSENLNLL